MWIPVYDSKAADWEIIKLKRLDAKLCDHINSANDAVNEPVTVIPCVCVMVC